MLKPMKKTLKLIKSFLLLSYLSWFNLGDIIYYIFVAGISLAILAWSTVYSNWREILTDIEQDKC